MMGEDFELIEGGDNLSLAYALTKEGNYKAALVLFEAEESYKKYPLLNSCYALCMAAVWGEYDKAKKICLTALKHDLYNANIYLNLGGIFLSSGKKKLAMKAFLKGLKMDSAHAGIIKEARSLGLRRKPVIKALSRHNPVNRVLGRVTHRFGV